MKKLIPILLAAILTLLLLGCGAKLVSPDCAWCGEPSTKNYTNPDSIEVTISGESKGSFVLPRDGTVSLCDDCFRLVEMMNGKSK